MTASSSGGSSFTGQGQSLAVAGVIATNRVLSSATALIDGADVTTTSGDVDRVRDELIDDRRDDARAR